jgi:hypothetical protein
MSLRLFLGTLSALAYVACGQDASLVNTPPVLTLADGRHPDSIGLISAGTLRIHFRDSVPIREHTTAEHAAALTVARQAVAQQADSSVINRVVVVFGWQAPDSGVMRSYQFVGQDVRQ